MRPAMSDPIRELLADLPLANMVDRPVGMIALRRSEVPDAERASVDAWVEERGGRIVSDSVFKVHNGRSPEAGGGDAFYVLPPSAFKV